MMLKLDLSAYPSVLNYIKLLSERPAFKEHWDTRLMFITIHENNCGVRGLVSIFLTD